MAIHDNNTSAQLRNSFFKNYERDISGLSASGKWLYTLLYGWMKDNGGTLGLSNREISARAGMPAGLTSRLFKTMVRTGLICPAKDGSYSSPILDRHTHISAVRASAAKKRLIGAERRSDGTFCPAKVSVLSSKTEPFVQQNGVYTDQQNGGFSGGFSDCEAAPSINAHAHAEKSISRSGEYKNSSPPPPYPPPHQPDSGGGGPVLVSDKAKSERIRIMARTACVEMAKARSVKLSGDPPIGTVSEAVEVLYSVLFQAPDPEALCRQVTEAHAAFMPRWIALRDHNSKAYIKHLSKWLADEQYLCAPKSDQECGKASAPNHQDAPKKPTRADQLTHEDLQVVYGRGIGVSPEVYAAAKARYDRVNGRSAHGAA